MEAIDPEDTDQTLQKYELKIRNWTWGITEENILEFRNVPSPQFLFEGRDKEIIELLKNI